MGPNNSPPDVKRCGKSGLLERTGARRASGEGGATRRTDYHGRGEKEETRAGEKGRRVEQSWHLSTVDRHFTPSQPGGEDALLLSLALSLYYFLSLILVPSASLGTFILSSSHSPSLHLSALRLSSFRNSQPRRAYAIDTTYKSDMYKTLSSSSSSGKMNELHHIPRIGLNVYSYIL